jgi:hypothetical protein
MLALGFWAAAVALQLIYAKRLNAYLRGAEPGDFGARNHSELMRSIPVPVSLTALRITECVLGWAGVVALLIAVQSRRVTTPAGTTDAVVKGRTGRSYDTLRAVFAATDQLEKIRELLDKSERSHGDVELQRDSEAVTQAARVLLDECRKVEPARLESIYSGWSEAFNRLLLPASAMFARGMQEGDNSKIAEADRVMEQWVTRSLQNNECLTRTLEQKFGLKIPIRGP